MESHQIEELITMVAAMDREELKAKFHAFRGSFPVDFTEDFLTRLPLDRLQHIFVALCIQHNQSLPDAIPTAA